MAEMNVGMNTPMTPVTPVQNTPVREVSAQRDVNRIEQENRDPRREAEAAAEKAPANQQRELDNVVSVSKDGDTVQASPKGVEKLTEDTSVRRISGEENAEREVSARPEANFRTDDSENTVRREDAEKAASERKEEMLRRVEEEEQRRADVMEKIEAENQPERVPANREEPQEPVRVDVGENSPERKVTSYAGITNQQLEQMYLEGTISKYDYDSEISSREDQKEAAQQNNEQVNENAVELMGIANQSRQNFDAIENAYDNREETADEARRATERLEAMTTVQQAMDRQ